MFCIRYLGALIYDGIILVALFILLTAICLLFRHGVAIPPASQWYQLLLVSILYGYYFLSYQQGGQTIGMKAWHLRLISLDNQTIRNKQILARFFLGIPAVVLAIFCLKSPMRILRKWTGSELVVV
jgi:uncharacterized RDD family membrane protein YckC